MRRKIKFIEMFLDEKGKLSSTRVVAMYIIVCLVTPICITSLFSPALIAKPELVTNSLAALGMLTAACLGVGQYSKGKILSTQAEKKVKGP